MSFYRNFLIIGLATAFIAAGCSYNPKESGGDVSGNLGFKGTVECLLADTCHSVGTTPLTTWSAGAHANVAVTPGVASSVDPECTGCHNPIEWDSNDSAFLFTPTSYLGATARPIVGCEACHGTSMEHFAYAGTAIYSFTGSPFGDTHYIPDTTAVAGSVFGNQYHNNSCGPCHAPDKHAGGASLDNILTNQYQEWFGADGVVVLSDDGHVDSLIVETLQGYMTSDVRGTPCAACHTVEGFVRIKSGSETLSQTEIDRIVSETGDTDLSDPSPLPGGGAIPQVSCVSCHPSHDPGGNTIRPPFAIDDLCIQCHNIRELMADDGAGQLDTSSLEIPRHPQKELFEGFKETANDGYRAVELPSFAGSDSLHAGTDNITNGCSGCHYLTVKNVEITEFPLQATTGHTFRPRLETCLTGSPCHDAADFLLSDGSAAFPIDTTTIASFDFGSIYYSVIGQPGASADHDSDGTVEPFQQEIQGMLDDLKNALTSRGVVFDSTQGVFDLEDMASFTTTERAAAYNYDFIVGDRSLGMHNPVYVVNLLNASIAAVPVP